MLKEMAASGTYVPAEPALASFCSRLTRASDTCSTFVRESPVLAIYTDLLFVDNPLVISARLFPVPLFNVPLFNVLPPILAFYWPIADTDRFPANLIYFKTPDQISRHTTALRPRPTAMTDNPNDNERRLAEWTYATIVDAAYHDDRGGWEEVFDYRGLRYHAILWPSPDGTGLQDTLLTSLARACEANDDIMDDYADKCRALIWPLIARDWASRPASQKTGPQKNKVVRVEGRTVDGVIKGFRHKRVLDNSFHPIKNTFPGVPTFPEREVKRVQQIDTEIFKVEHAGEFYCLKTVYGKGGETALTREIEILRQCKHTHIIPLRGLVVNKKNKVEGMLLEYIPRAVTLNDFEGPGDGQRWVDQFRSAMEYLHSRGMVWGDAKPQNILVRRKGDAHGDTDGIGNPDGKANVDGNAKRDDLGEGDLVLVDFAGGATDDWVDWKVMNSLEGDLMASPKIEKFILEKAKAPEGMENGKGKDSEGKLGDTS